MELQPLFRELKALPFRGGTSLWVIHRRLVERKAVYKVLRVEIDDKLKTKLRELAAAAIAAATSVSGYEYQGQIAQGQWFALDAKAGGFDEILARIEDGSEVATAQKAEDLVDSWAYVTRINTANAPVYAFRKVSKAWSTKQVGGGLSMSAFFENGKLFALQAQQVFRIDEFVDFVCYRDTLFIADKDQFEHAMNFRETLKSYRDEVIGDFEKSALFSDAEMFRTVIGDNLPLLHRMASVRRNGYYKDPAYVNAMVKEAQARGWGIEVVDEKIVVDASNVELVLRLINNDRLQSPINWQVFDVTGVKQLVPPAAPRLAIAKPDRAPARKSPPRKSVRVKQKGA